MKTIFISGGSGFIGANLINYFLFKNKNIKIINIDKLTYASNKNFIKVKNFYKIYKHYNIDIKNRKKINELFKKYNPNSFINLAAESHVDNSILKPNAFINTNIIGTYNLLLTTKSYLSQKDNIFRKKFKFIHVSTDEVFGDIGFNGKPSKEMSVYKPSSPYSASKAASDHLVRAWIMTYNFPAIITNCTNNYGPFQNKEKLIPKTIINALSFLPIPIYSHGKQIRDWLYVEDHVRALIAVLKYGKVGESYNIGATNEMTNLVLVKEICKRLDKIYPSKNKNYKSYSKLIKHVDDRPGHDQRYALNTDKIKKLNWNPKNSFENGINKTIDFYLKKIND